jgi:hypothetical protein
MANPRSFLHAAVQHISNAFAGLMAGPGLGQEAAFDVNAHADHQ